MHVDGRYYVKYSSNIIILNIMVGKYYVCHVIMYFYITKYFSLLNLFIEYYCATNI